MSSTTRPKCRSASGRATPARRAPGTDRPCRGRPCRAPPTQLELEQPAVEIERLVEVADLERNVVDADELRAIAHAIEASAAGPFAAGGNSIDARSLTSAVSGTLMRPRWGRSRSKVTSSRKLTEHGCDERRGHAATQDREVGGEEAERDGGAEDLEQENRVGDAVREPRDASRALVDHLVQRLDVEPRRAVNRSPVERLSGRPPQPALEFLALGHSGVRLGAAGHRVREPNGVCPRRA